MRTTCLLVVVLATLVISLAFVLLPVHADSPEILFPFRSGTTWQITQGYSNPTSTHGGSYPDEVYAFDLKVVKKNEKGEYVVNDAETLHQDVLAAADGVLVWVRLTEEDHGCLLLRHEQYTEKLPSGKEKYFFSMYCHMTQIQQALIEESGVPCLKTPTDVKSSTPSTTAKDCARVRQGDRLGLADSVGVDANNPHIHFHLFSAIGDPLGQAGRVPEQLLHLKGWVVKEKGQAEGTGYLKETWPDIGGSNQYSGWIVEKRELSSVIDEWLKQAQRELERKVAEGSARLREEWERRVGEGADKLREETERWIAEELAKLRAELERSLAQLCKLPAGLVLAGLAVAVKRRT